MLYILPPIHGITQEIRQIQNEYSGIILDYENGDICEEAQRLSHLIKGENNTLLGFSIGGLISLEIAYLHPTKVQKVLAVRTLTHPKNIPFRIGFYMKMLRVVPSSIFTVLYQRRHSTSNNLPSKENLMTRLTAVQGYIPRPFARAYWIDPVGKPLFGTRISNTELIENIQN